MAGEKCKFILTQDPNNGKISLTGFNKKFLTMVVENVNPVRFQSQQEGTIRVFKSASSIPRSQEETRAWFHVVPNPNVDLVKHVFGSKEKMQRVLNEICLF